MKSRGGKSQRRKSEEKVREEKTRKKKTKEERKLRNTVFPMICGVEGLKSRLATAAGAEPAG